MQGFMTRKQSKFVLWLTMPVVVAFVVAIILANIFAVAAPPAKATSLSCSSDGSTFYGLDNTIVPGKIGFQTAIGCNQSVSGMSVGSCLEKTSGFGTWIPASSIACATKSTSQAKIGYSHTLWYTCTGGITQTDSATYRGKSSYNVPGLSSNIDVITGVHGSRCLGPELYKTS